MHSWFFSAGTEWGVKGAIPPMVRPLRGEISYLPGEDSHEVIPITTMTPTEAAS